MPILVRLPPTTRRQKVVVKAGWRASYAQELARQIDKYCQAPAVSTLIWRCPHGVYLTAAEEPTPYCTVCHAWVSPERPRMTSLRTIDSIRYYLTAEGPGLLRRFPRRGTRYLDKAHYDHETDSFYPADHEISLFDERLRFRKAETRGGYICAGYGEDGIAIRAGLGWGETGEGELRCHLRAGLTQEEFQEENWLTTYSEADELKPDIVVGNFLSLTGKEIERAREETLEASRPILEIVVSSPQDAAHTALIWFEDERTICAEKDGLYRRAGSDEWTDCAPAEAADPQTTRFYSSER